MKKLFFAVVFMMTALASNAQIQWDVRVGTNVSGIENSEAKMKLGLKAGVGIDYAFSDAFSVRPMLFYSSKGVTEGKSNLGFFPDKTMSLGYIELPVLASYHFRLTDNFSLVANAGPYAAYLVSKKNTADVKYNTFDAGVNAGLDFVFRRVVLGVEAEYGLSSLSSNVAKLHNINYSLMLGYKF
jgi:opacity protein-like surface antigen